MDINKDELDIVKGMEHLRIALESGDGLMFDRDLLSEDTGGSILAAIKLGLEAGAEGSEYK